MKKRFPGKSEDRISPRKK